MGDILKKLKENLLIFVISEIICILLLGLAIVLNVGQFSYLIVAGLSVVGFLNIFFPVWIWFGFFVFSLQIIVLWNFVYGVAPIFVYFVMFFLSVVAMLVLKFSTEIAEDYNVGTRSGTEIYKDKDKYEQRVEISRSQDQSLKFSDSPAQQGDSYSDELSYLDAEVKNSVLSNFDESKQKYKTIFESCKKRVESINIVVNIIDNVCSELLNIFTFFSSHQKKFKEIQLFMESSILKVLQELERLHSSNVGGLQVEEKTEDKVSYDYQEVQNEVNLFEDVVNKLSSYFESLDVKKVYNSMNSLYNALSFLKLLVSEIQRVINNSFSVSLKIMQMSSISNDIGVRRSLTVILQDMDSILFKFSVYIKNFYDAVYDFSFNLEDFMNKLTDVEKSAEEIEQALLLIKSSWKNAVQPKIPLFVEKIEQLTSLQHGVGIYDDLSKMAGKSKEFFSAFRRFSEWIEAVSSEIINVVSATENILSGISELLRKFYTIKSELEKLSAEIKSIQNKLPYISEYDLSSPVLIKDVSKLINDIKG